MWQEKVIPPCDKMERKAANRVIICGAFNRERYRELINPSVVVKGVITPTTQTRRTRLWQVRLYRVVGVLNMRRGSNYCGTIS